jgi:hypothetical protein
MPGSFALRFLLTNFGFRGGTLGGKIRKVEVYRRPTNHFSHYQIRVAVMVAANILGLAIAYALLVGVGKPPVQNWVNIIMKHYYSMVMRNFI